MPKLIPCFFWSFKTGDSLR